MPIDGGPPPRVPFRRRSRVVAWAKVLLPLAALALLSTIFLLARDPGGPAEIPFARLEEIAREPRMDRPRLAGVADDGTTVALTADRIAPIAGRPDAFAVEAPRLETRTPGGATARLEAQAGEADGRARTLALSGGVRIETGRGIVATAPDLRADLGSGSLAAGPVRAEAPFGAIEAGALELRQGEGEGARLLFHRGVRLLYVPGRPTSPEAP